MTRRTKGWHRGVGFLLVLVVVGAGISGCHSEKKDPEKKPVVEKESTASLSGSDLDLLKEGGERWDLVHLEGSPVGYQQTTVEPGFEGNEDWIGFTTKVVMEMRRFGDRVKTETEGISVETRDGKLVRLEGTQPIGGNSVKTRAEVNGDRLQGTAEVMGMEREIDLPFPDDAGGPNLLTLSLLNQPMEPDEKRSLQFFDPALLSLVKLELTARDEEPTALLQDGEFSLLRIDGTMEVQNRKIPMIFWCDRTGTIHKLQTPSMNMEMFRASRKQAMLTTDVPFDIGRFTVIPTNRTIENPYATSRATYRVTLRTANAAQAFPASASQETEPVSERTAIVTVRSLRPEGGDASDSGDQNSQDLPTEADLGSSPWIQADDPEVVAMAEKAAPEGASPWETAQALERFVHENIKKVNYSQLFSSATEVAEKLEGDCTEHALLLAALGRARGIPSRVVVGLVYAGTPTEGGFAFHMWNEMAIGDRWIPMDATLARGGTGAARLRITASSLSEVTLTDLIFPIFDLMGQTEIAIVSVEHDLPSGSSEGPTESTGQGGSGEEPPSTDASSEDAADVTPSLPGNGGTGTSPMPPSSSGRPETSSEESP